MKKLLITGLILTCCMFISTLSFAQEEGSWTGEIVDLDCYIGNGLKGADHATCAKTCITAGKPAGLLTDSGDVILLVAGDKADVIAELAGQKADITGKKSEKGGVTMIVVTDAKKSDV